MTTPPRKTEDNFTVERGHLAAPHIPLGRMNRRGAFIPAKPRKTGLRVADLRRMQRNIVLAEFNKTRLSRSIAIVLRWWRAGVGA